MVDARSNVELMNTWSFTTAPSFSSGEAIFVERCAPRVRPRAHLDH
jgi:hypothetical protein